MFTDLQGREFQNSVCSHWGDKSIVPREVNVMALSATATRHTRMDVIKKLGMKNCAVVSCSPHKPNITLEVKEKSDLSTVLTPLVIY